MAYHSTILGKEVKAGVIRPTTLHYSANGATGRNTGYLPRKINCAECNEDKHLVLYAGKRLKKPVCINCYFEEVVK
jgi:hypothetical protein